MLFHGTYSGETDLSGFAVARKRQRMGVGSLLLRHCLALADQDGLPIWLNSFPRSHGLYLRSGFEDVEHCDLDLNAFDGSHLRGYGIYRTYAMVRRPAGAISG